MRKILIYKSGLLPYSETFIKEQVLTYKKWEAKLIGLRRVEGLDLKPINPRLLLNGNGKLSSEIVWKFLSRCGLSYPGILRKLKKENADLLHIHFGIDAVNFWPIAKKLNIPVVVSLHGYDINIYREWWESGREGMLNTAYPRRLIKLSKNKNVHFVAVSEAIRERAIQYGLSPDRISVQYIGINPKNFSPGGKALGERNKRILYVGRMVEKKGGAILIKAFAEIYREMPDAELVMIGDGPLLQQYKQLSRTLNVPVCFLGPLSSQDVKNNLDLAKIFCLPSITAVNGDAEGLGIVILEAQAAGVPVVTSARGGAKEGIIHGETGFSFPEGDLAALVSSLRTILVNHDLAVSMSNSARKFVLDKFDIDQCSLKLENYYDEIIKNLQSAH